MRIVKVNLKDNPYQIIIGKNIIGSLGQYIKKIKLGNDAYCVSSALIKDRYGLILNRALKREGFSVKFKLVSDTEKAKSISVASSVIRDISRFDKKKKIFIIAFGGGVIGDLSGFVASVYKRGTPYIQVPTTLLAQIDSSIGGKTGVDLLEGKNLLGAFYQPKLVFSDVGLLKSLDLRQIRSGLAEAIKYGIIKDPVFFSYLEKRYEDILALDSIVLEFIVWRCSRIKARIVQEDEREEKGIRTVLNFGHTIGHAIEAAGSYKNYNHGESIALGMLVACGISQDLGLISQENVQRIEQLIKSVGLPIKIKNIALEKIIKAHYHDKKFSGRKNKFVLIEDIGRVKILENVSLTVIKEAIEKRIASEKSRF